MKTLAFISDENFKSGYPVEWVKAPAHDKTATGFAFGAPYHRIRFDKKNKNFYVMRDGKPVTVVIATLGV